MKDIIKLNSKYGESNTLKLLKKLDGESKTYLLKSSNTYYKSGFNEHKRKYLEPSGGPVIVEGEELEEAEATVKSIDHIVGKGYCITFE